MVIWPFVIQGPLPGPVGPVLVKLEGRSTELRKSSTGHPKGVIVFFLFFSLSFFFFSLCFGFFVFFLWIGPMRVRRN